MPEYGLILTLTGGLSAALLFGYLTHRIGLSPIVGYLAAGLVVGPYTPGFVADAGLAEELAEVGVILLMFGVGLQFHVAELLAVRNTALPGAVTASGVATLLGFLLARAFGWEWAGSLVFGMALGVASTVVLVRVLSDHNHLHTPAGHVAVGWLVVEDLFTVVALVLLPAVFRPASDGSSLWLALAGTALKVVALIAFTALVGTRVIPKFLDYIARTRSRELFTLAVLVIALSIAVGSAIAFSVSMALGAFLAGMVVGQSEHSLRAASDALPMRDAFAVLFFVSVGMLLDPRALLENPGLLLGALGIVLVAKPLAAFAIVWAMRYPLAVAMPVAVALSQIGEFSFILSAVGRRLGILTPAATNTLVATSIASIVVNPLIYRAVVPIQERLSTRYPWLLKLLQRPPRVPSDLKAPQHASRPASPRHRAVIIGYGPTGRTVARLLRENSVQPTVVDLNIETVRELRAQGIDAVFGDATRPDTLAGAGVASAGTMILTSAGMANSTEVIRASKALNPSIRILARGAYLRDLEGLHQAGADTVYAGEGEVALAFIEDILDRLGATPEQIDRERERAHRELFAK
jgi:monovalent cation:H+ antiporter-2, CPA2 family